MKGIDNTGFLDEFQDMFDYSSHFERNGGVASSTDGDLDIDSNFVEELQFLFDDPAFKNLDRVWTSKWQESSSTAAESI
jgi:hypothetical protein